MDRVIRRVQHAPVAMPRRKHVAAYARVSSGKDAMLQSLSAQVSYYSSMIQMHPDWEYCGVYADEAITGTKDGREKFQILLGKCRAGEVDMIITKSISRFARNTVTLLETVRELKRLGVDIYFEEQNIHTISAQGELLLTILASHAQEESRSASENQKWRIKKNFEAGIPWAGVMLGYRMSEGHYIIVPEEAEVVRRIYTAYLDGMGYEAIARELNEEGVLTRKGFQWTHGGIQRILKNYAYTGNLLLQRFYSENHITKRKCTNNGERAMYYVENTHEAIVPLEIYQQVQKERMVRADHFAKTSEFRTYPFTSKLYCTCCGKNYRRKVTPHNVVWICTTYNRKGKQACAESKQIPEEILLKTATEVMGLEKFDSIQFSIQVARILVYEGNLLQFEMNDGRVLQRIWKDRSRSESWTPEKRKAASHRRAM